MQKTLEETLLSSSVFPLSAVYKSGIILFMFVNTKTRFIGKVVLK